jgi:aminoglycoside phosphotransferase family enzyme/predicted kinase
MHRPITPEQPRIESEMDDAPEPVQVSAALLERLRSRLQRGAECPVELVETHISWVLLVGATAYKVKKPIGLPFLDFRTLERRRHFCEEELRVNRRTARALYLGISRITGTAAEPQIDGCGPTLEYAVRMRRFPAGSLLSDHAAAGDLRPSDVDRLAEHVAALHCGSPHAAPQTGYGSPEYRARGALAALDGIEELLSVPMDGLDHLRGWLRQQAEALAGVWRERQYGGWVREGHGDLHLGNALLLDDDVCLFDAIEFDPALRWIDIVDDAAFAAMDLMAAGHAGLGFRFMNGWLERVGDHEGLALWRYALAYRALVRAHVSLLRERQRNVSETSACDRYLELALRLARPSDRPGLLITHGLPGSGKSVISGQLLERCGAIRCRSDVERKRMLGLPPLGDTRTLDSERAAYGEGATLETYGRLERIARLALQAGWPVIVDAAFLRRAERQRFADLARSLGCSFSVLDCRAPMRVLRQRVEARHATKLDASEAGVEVLEQLERCAEPLEGAEILYSIPVETARSWNVDDVARRWHAKADAAR